MNRASKVGLLLAGVAALLLLAFYRSELQWVWEERQEILGAVRATTVRLASVIVIGLIVGVSLARLMRVSRRIEAKATPWVLAFLSVPWLLLMVAINLIPSLGLDETAATGLAVAAFAVQIWALGRRKLEDSREVYVRRAFSYAFVAVMAGELLARTDGLGAQVRFFTLFSRFEHVLLYAALLAVLSMLLLPLVSLMLRVGKSSFLLQG
ncbi:hypothetical protein [Deinococcus yavapaiensis]|uniref:ABC-type nitrate/sulfonate/bicarbonate transport system permease component n=1 Tax=Deinococcus yavapaiensis KR-236 TaxID=694435 RepID=A0A318S405_9DEIO|nr:hypothetical protein [Deinococcus yavapaiensis]PYE53275.1 ABC-type nitrate/sulfonate/bicarbonate transport system permease component [Deinococcus yavapaiensis KR-236]